MNIYIIHTPLHYLICNKINRTFDHDDACYIFINRNKENKKIKYYYNKCQGNKHYINSSKIITVFKLFNLVKKYEAIENIYIGNPFLIESRCLIKKMHNKVITFDDGYCNIDTNSKMREDDSNFRKIMFRIIRIPNKDEIKQKVLSHISIFKNEDNYVDNVTYINLYEFPKINVENINKDKKTRKLLIGSTYFEDGKMSLIEEKRLYKTIIDKYSIDEYIAHPREKNKKVDIPNIHTEKVSEEYIIDNLVKYNFTLYGIDSSVLFNLRDVTGVKVNFINVDDIINSN